MNARDQVLRALVYAAWELRGTYVEGYHTEATPMRVACQRIVTAHAIWPLVEYQYAIERAEAELEQRRLQEERELLAWYASIDALDLPFDTEAARAA